MTRRDFPQGFAIAALIGLGVAVPATAADYLSQFNGEWAGGGSVRTDKLPAPVNVSCEVAGTQADANGFELAGNCRAMLVMNRDIGAELKRDPGTGTYTGTYTGGASGPAALEGTEQNGRLDLVVTWQRAIFGDSVARMVIVKNADDSFTMQVVDQIEGEDVTVSDLSFERS